ncbi:MAG: hypothetical protein ACLFP2_01840 [Candidatus Woesearchaeota archaeon]
MKGMIVLMIVGLLLAGCANKDTTSDAYINGSEQVKNEITLGYCPTMAELAEDMAENNNVSLKPFGSTSQALQALNNGQVDVILVGRLAGGHEVGAVHEKRLKEGLTLVGKEKRFIHADELLQSTVHTAEEKEIVKTYLPDNEDVVFHESTENAINEGIDEIVLINWTDFSDEFGLVIPADSTGQKIEKFRIPVLYSYRTEYIERLRE